METTLQNSEYKDFLSGVKSEIRNAQIKAMVKVNHELLQLYWNMGYGA